MPAVSRCLGALLLTCPLLLLACSDSPTPPDAGTPPPAEAWDGTYTPLEERTDWIDRGPFSPCTFTAPLETELDCDTPALFDLSQCDRGALATVERHGVYQVELRSEDGFPSFVGFRLPPDGGTGTMLSRPLARQQFDDEGLFLSLSYSLTNGGTRQYALAGCGVPEAGRFTGCYARCASGRLVDKGTFDAQRMTWARGEAESSGGLNLLSESFVDIGEPVDVYVTKNHAYVVSIHARDDPPGGLTVFDVSDRRHPVLKKTLSLPNDGFWNAAWAKDDALYIASRDSGVRVYDISNPADPAFVRNVPGGSPLDVHTLFVDGNRLYAMATWPASQTLVFDVSSPLAPVLLNRITLPTGDFIYSYPHDAFAYQDRLYISHTDYGYVVTDVGDVNQVQELGRYTFDGTYSHSSVVGTFAGRTIAFEGSEGQGAHLRALDVTDPANIQLIGEHRLRSTTSIHNMALRGSRLYVVWHQEGLRVLDVANPTRPREIAYFNTYRESDPGRGDYSLEGAIGVRVPGDGYVYVTDTQRGLLIFNEP